VLLLLLLLLRRLAAALASWDFEQASCKRSDHPALRLKAAHDVAHEVLRQARGGARVDVDACGGEERLLEVGDGPGGRVGGGSRAVEAEQLPGGGDEQEEAAPAPFEERGWGVGGAVEGVDSGDARAGR